MVGRQRGEHLDCRVLSRLETVEQVALLLTPIEGTFLHFFTERVAVVRGRTIVDNPHSSFESPRIILLQYVEYIQEVGHLFLQLCIEFNDSLS